MTTVVRSSIWIHLSRRLQVHLPPIFLVLLVTGCTGGVNWTEEKQSVRVYKDAGYVQCRPESGVPLTEMERPLLEAGLHVLSSTCGGDGLVQPAMCEIGMGIVAIFELPASDAGAAEKLGYHLLRPSPQFKTGVICKY